MLKILFIPDRFKKAVEKVREMIQYKKSSSRDLNYMFIRAEKNDYQQHLQDHHDDKARNTFAADLQKLIEWTFPYRIYGRQHKTDEDERDRHQVGNNGVAGQFEHDLVDNIEQEPLHAPEQNA